MIIADDRVTWTSQWRLALALAIFALPAEGRAQEVGTALYVRTDSDNTTVVAPRLRVQSPAVQSTRVSLIYTVDVWTSASIDIVSSASRIPVTEQRDELDVAVDHELEDVSFTAAYRLSIEPDYVSHGGSGGLSYDFAENNATLAVGLSGSSDSVGRAGHPEFSRDAGMLGGRLSFTQVLGKDTIAQVTYELLRVTGYQASPYRFVAIGNGPCTTRLEGTGVLAPTCVPENSPGERLRHAAALELRHAFGSRWSLAGAYRYYIDDWGLGSHTARGEAAYLPEADTILSVRYRFYTQTAADHYRARYDAVQAYVTSDKELSTMSSHRVALEFDRLWSFAEAGTLTTTVSFAPLFYIFSDFLPLDQITAYEVTAGLVYAP